MFVNTPIRLKAKCIESVSGKNVIEKSFLRVLCIEHYSDGPGECITLDVHSLLSEFSK